MRAGSKKTTANIAVYHDGDVVVVAVDGPITPAVGDSLMQRSLEALRQYHRHRLLQDLRRARTAESTLHLLTRPRMAEEMGFPDDLRLALLCNVVSTDIEMVVKLARARGHAVQAFTDGSMAIAWLRAG